jgi:hypothetical protein
MANNIKDEHIPVVEVIRKKEEMGLKFFKECINRTNQFSAQYILNKFLNTHINHVEELKQEMTRAPSDKINSKVVMELESRYSLKDLCMEFDLSTLTFLEAAQIMIRMAERDIEFYTTFKTKHIEKSTQKLLKKIVAQKAAYADRLRDEYSRLEHQR